MITTINTDYSLIKRCITFVQIYKTFFMTFVFFVHTNRNDYWIFCFLLATRGYMSTYRGYEP